MEAEGGIPYPGVAKAWNEPIHPVPVKGQGLSGTLTIRTSLGATVGPATSPSRVAPSPKKRAVEGEEAKEGGPEEGAGEKDFVDPILETLRGPRWGGLRACTYYDGAKGAYSFLAGLPVLRSLSPHLEGVLEAALARTSLKPASPEEAGEKSLAVLDHKIAVALTQVDEVVDEKKDLALDGLGAVKKGIKAFSPSDTAKGAVGGAKSTISGAATSVQDTATGAVSKVTTLISEIWSSITGKVTSTCDKVSSAAGSTVSRAKSTAGSTITATRDAAGSTVSRAKSTVGSTITATHDAAAGAVGKAQSVAGDAVGAAFGAVDAAKSRAGDAAAGVQSAVGGAVGGAVSTAQGVMGGAVSTAQGVVGGAMDLAGKAVAMPMGVVGGVLGWEKKEETEKKEADKPVEEGGAEASAGQPSAAAAGPAPELEVSS